MKEFAPTIAAWEAFFLEAVRSVLLALPPKSAAVFYQTDIRLAGNGTLPGEGKGQISKACFKT